MEIQQTLDSLYIIHGKLLYMIQEMYLANRLTF
jgi:hypothetical protein